MNQSSRQLPVNMSNSMSSCSADAEHVPYQPKSAAVYQSVLYRDIWLMLTDKLLWALSSSDLKC